MDSVEELPEAADPAQPRSNHDAMAGIPDWAAKTDEHPTLEVPSVAQPEVAAPSLADSAPSWDDSPSLATQEIPQPADDAPPYQAPKPD